MANVNKKKHVTKHLGLPSKEALMTSPMKEDTLLAKSEPLQGGLEATDIRLTEGEFVFSLPSIIALGEGDYDTGLETLTQMHDQLKLMGEELLQQQQSRSPQ